MTVILPFDIIIKIMSYILDPSERPYLDDIKLTSDVIMPHGVRVALTHIKTVRALQSSYSNHKNPPEYIHQLYGDCWHIV